MRERAQVRHWAPPRSVMVALGALVICACGSGGLVPSEDSAGGSAPTDTGSEDTRVADISRDATDTAPAPDTGVGSGDIGDARDASDDSLASGDIGTPTPPPLDETCRQVATGSLPISEASGAVTLSGGVLVVSDSGNNGAAVIIADLDGQTTPISLPLGDGAGDDLEGLASVPGEPDRFIAITSAGSLRHYRVAPAAAEAPPLATLEDGPYAVSEHEDLVCDPMTTNCGPNYEGLCLHPAPNADAPCAGFAVSKGNGELVCLRFDGAGRLVAKASHRVPMPRPESVPEGEGWLSGCTFEPQAPWRLVVAGNLYSASRLWHVDGWDNPASALISEVAYFGPINQEAVLSTAVGAFISFGDLQNIATTSPSATYTCP